MWWGFEWQLVVLRTFLQLEVHREGEVHERGPFLARYVPVVVRPFPAERRVAWGRC